MSQDASDKLIDLVKRSELVPSKKLDSFLEKAAQAPGGVPASQDKVAEMLVADGLLTRWQADKLLAGKHRGFRLGKYKLLGEIGKGGMSHVYLAEHVLMERRVAIKVLPRQRVKDRSYLARFQLEARAAARLDDPNIVRVFDIDTDTSGGGQTHYIVMEYVDGRDLHQTVSKNGPLPFATAVRYIAQVATGLQHAHEMGLVHRDIKPANCLVDHNGVVKLLDMGLAKLNDDETSLTLANDENVLGTADYLAPEQALNSHSADARADIYSLGCTFYFLLVGRPPFPDGTISERLLKHQVEEPQSLLTIRPDTPLTLVDLCSRMMSKKPDDRPQTAGDVSRLLNDWLAERGETTVGAGSSGSGFRSAGEGLGSGVGSGILSRFTQTPPPGSLSRPGSGAGTSGASDTAKLYAAPSVDTDEDIGLAPLDEDEMSPKARQAKKAAASSGVLSDESNAKLGSKGAASKSGAAPSDATKGASSKSSASKSGVKRSSSGSAAAKSGPEKPATDRGVDSNAGEAASLSSPSRAVKPKSIFDEEYAAPTGEDPYQRRARRAAESDYDPLHPPGYVNPYTKTPWWVFVIGALFAALVIFVVAKLVG
ncbi:Serine/threonine-protein kinase PrkC [Botrimarina colliarenosi]|uniref:non-specific serine/threonine protein kinase n=1 Tax=Botrimarina colliarenosi TaxID=2528001 RepID=A0A5C6A8Z1_9BACT|nr:serine/threonine-protein kinase [Botrimarina colliarenosi]TWT95896.1 Serine/threonine-protein kinase PrkC [Botrimarina colliarenosi]